MARFIGEKESSLDSRSRFTIPAPFRKSGKDALGDELCVTLRPGGFLSIVPVEVFEAHVESVESSDQTSGDIEEYLEGLYRFTETVAMDSNNRILLTGKMKKHIGLQKVEGGEIVRLLGMGKGFRLYNDERCADDDSNFGQFEKSSEKLRQNSGIRPLL